MTKYIVKRLLQSLISVFGAVVIVFFMIRLSGDPARLMLPPEATEEQVEALRESLGFTRPVIIQFLDFVKNAATGNFGRSLFYKQPVLELIIQRLPNTLLLAFAAILLSVIIGGLVGILTAYKHDTPVDYILSGIVQFCQSMPVFWIGIILIMVFSVKFHVLPTSGFDNGFKSLILPSVALAFYSSAPIAKTTRASMIRVMNENYITVSKAHGFSDRAILVKKALRNAALPVVTVIGLEFGSLLGGAVVCETVFAWPGLGSLIIQGISNRDFPLVQGGTLIVSTMYILLNFIIDILYLYINPRIRVEG